MVVNKNILGVIFYIILILIGLNYNLRAQDNSVNITDTINIVVTIDIIGDVNRIDAQAAMELTMREMTRDYSDVVKMIMPEIVTSMDEVKDRIEKNKADVVGLFTLDYIKYRSKLPIEPQFMMQRELEPGIKYVLVAKNNNQINSLSDLKSKQILTLSIRDKEIVEKWLYVEMKKEKVNNPLEIIRNFIEIPKPNKRVFSVFFGKDDACILTKFQYESMCELNPQLKKELKIVSESPSFLTHIFCRNMNSQKFGIEDSQEYAKITFQKKSGKNILKLFKAQRIINFEDSYLETIETLSKNYNRYITE